MNRLGSGRVGACFELSWPVPTVASLNRVVEADVATKATGAMSQIISQKADGCSSSNSNTAEQTDELITHMLLA
jgi:hypothetical protein